MDNILAIATYGSQRIKHPQTKRTISAYKMGYSTAASAVLLALYGSKARNVSPKQASYHYIQIDGDVTVRRGFILLSVSAEALIRAEAITRRFYYASTYHWREDKWYALPSSENDTYREAILGSSGPRFDPSGTRPVSLSTGEKEVTVEGIRVERSQRDPNQKPWYWLLGDTYPHRETLKHYGARFSGKRRAWYYIGWELPDGIQRLIPSVSETSSDAASVVETAATPMMSPELEAQILDVLAQDDAADVEQSSVTTENKGQQTELLNDTHQPAVRVMKPTLLPTDGAPLDEVQTAIIQAKRQPTPVVHPAATSQKPVLATIGQACVGELTGSITGNVWCYGYAIHDGICVYVNVGGPRMAVEAIRAKFSKGEIVNCVPWDAPAVELTAGEGHTGMYHDYMQNIPEAKFTSLILCHDLLVNPNYGGKSTTFIFRTDDMQAGVKLKQHVTELVKVPVFNEWADYLYHAGQTAMLVRQTRSAGDIDLLMVDLDIDSWTRLITGGIQQGVISLPIST
jgi:hypothetical protein